MLRQIGLLRRSSLLGALDHTTTTRVDTLPRRTSSQPQVHAPGARTSTTATWHSYCTVVTLAAQLRLQYTPTGTRSSNTWKRSPSSDYARHEQRRCFTRGASNQRGLGSRGRQDEWDSLSGIWDEEGEVDGAQDGYQAEAGEPRREVVKVNNGGVELE